MTNKIYDLLNEIRSCRTGHGTVCYYGVSTTCPTLDKFKQSLLSIIVQEI
jgi:hypothetical protein